MPRYNIVNPLSDEGRNQINSMFEELYKEYTDAGQNALQARESAIKSMADSLLAKEIAEETKRDLINIIREQTQNGDLAPEITQARGTHSTVGERLDSQAGQLAQTETLAQTTSADLNDREINVRRPPYNAKANGVDDDSAVIQSAIDFISSRKGGTVFIPRGVYRIAQTITLKSNVNIRGEGMLWPDNDRGTLLQCDPDISGFYTGFAEGDTGWLRNVKLTDFAVRGNKETSNAGYGLYGANFRYNSILDRVQFSHFKKDGINLTDNWSMAFYNVRAMHNGECGINFPKSANNISLYSCVLNNNDIVGLSVKTYETISLFGGLVEKNNEGGVQLHGGQVFNVTGVYFELNKNYTIYVRGDSTDINDAVNIVGNRIFGNSTGNYGTSGVYIRENARNVLVQGNRIEGFITAGIQCEGATAERNTIISGNRFLTVPVDVQLINPTRAFQPMITSGSKIDFGKRQLGNFRFERGTTTERPTSNLIQGQPYYDTTLLKPIYWTGTQWRDGAGTVV